MEKLPKIRLFLCLACLQGAAIFSLFSNASVTFKNFVCHFFARLLLRDSFCGGVIFQSHFPNLVSSFLDLPTPFTILAANSDRGLSLAGEETRTTVWVSFSPQIYSTFEIWQFTFSVV